MGEEKKKRRKQLNDSWSGDLHKMFSDISFCLCILNGGFHLLCYEFAFVLGIFHTDLLRCVWNQWFSSR